MNDFSELYTNVNLENYTMYMDSAFGSGTSEAAHLSSFLMHHYIFSETHDEYLKQIPKRFLAVFEVTWLMFESAKQSYDNRNLNSEIYLNWKYDKANLAHFHAIIVDLHTGEMRKWEQLGNTNESSNISQAKALLEIMRSIPDFSKARIHTPSTYLSNCFSGKWHPRTARDVWDKIYTLCRVRNVKVVYENESESVYLRNAKGKD